MKFPVQLLLLLLPLFLLLLHLLSCFFPKLPRPTSLNLLIQPCIAVTHFLHSRCPPTSNRSTPPDQIESNPTFKPIIPANPHLPSTSAPTEHLFYLLHLHRAAPQAQHDHITRTDQAVPTFRSTRNALSSPFAFSYATRFSTVQPPTRNHPLLLSFRHHLRSLPPLADSCPPPPPPIDDLSYATTPLHRHCPRLDHPHTAHLRLPSAFMLPKLSLPPKLPSTLLPLFLLPPCPPLPSSPSPSLPPSHTGSATLFNTVIQALTHNS